MSLTPAQREALDQLSAITASDTTAAKERDERLLRENGWNVEITIEQIFSGGATEQQAETGTGSHRNSMDEFQVEDPLIGRAPPGSRRLSGSVNRPAGAGTSGVGLWGLITWPVNLVFGVITSTWYFIIRTFLPYSVARYLPRFLLPPSGGSSTFNRSKDPTAASRDFVRDLEQYTGCSATSNSLPSFWTGPYRDFLVHVRKEQKVGLVILVSGEHENDEEFKRDILVDQELIRVLKDKDILVWGADIRSREGYQVSQTLLVTTYPSLTFLSLLPPSPQSSSSSSAKLSILNSIAGPPSTITSASSIIQTLTTSVLPRATPFLNRLRRERHTLEEARHLRAEQDRAFKEAERKDREKMEARRQAEELERAQVARKEREEKDKADRIQQRREWRRYARKHLLPPSDGPIRVALRTPLSAERNIRNFASAPSTTQLFFFAETLLIPKSDTPESDPDSPPAGYEPEWDFRIVTTYPRREIEKVESGGEAQWDIIKGAGGALFAEKIEGGVWGEAEARELNGDDSDEEVVSD